ELHEVFFKWNQGMLHSFLIEITADILTKKDELTSNFLVDMILDNAHQNGTGAWTSEDAMSLQVPIPVIDIAVSMRDLSAYKKEREAAQEKLQGPGKKWKRKKVNLKMEDIATIWRGGCIIRSALLEDIRSAFSKQNDLPNIMLDDKLSKELVQSQNEIRKVIQTSVQLG